ncbi:hypothetical protein Tco_0090795 [Tanacetum coccineum]
MGEIACIAQSTNGRSQFEQSRLELSEVYFSMWKARMQSSEKMNGVFFSRNGMGNGGKTLGTSTGMSSPHHGFEFPELDINIKRFELGRNRSTSSTESTSHLNTWWERFDSIRTGLKSFPEVEEKSYRRANYQQQISPSGLIPTFLNFWWNGFRKVEITGETH